MQVNKDRYIHPVRNVNASPNSRGSLIIRRFFCVIVLLFQVIVLFSAFSLENAKYLSIWCYYYSFVLSEVNYYEKKTTRYSEIFQFVYYIVVSKSVECLERKSEKMVVAVISFAGILHGYTHSL